MMKRTGDSWMSPDDYGRTLPFFTVNLLVADLAKSTAFYTQVLGAKMVYSDPDFAAMRLKDLEFMLHTDHTYDHHPWHQAVGEWRTARIRRGTETVPHRSRCAGSSRASARG